VGRSPGSGNISWHLSRLVTRCKAGNVNRRRCSVIRRNGSRCAGIAIKGYDCCYAHGGRFVIARRKLKCQKLKHRAWTKPRSQQKSEAQIKGEARASLAAPLEFPLGKDV